MKNKKYIIGFCIVVLLVTTLLIVLTAMRFTKVVYMPSGSTVIMLIALAAMLLISFTAICVLQGFYEDWKWRHLKKNAKWKR